MKYVGENALKKWTSLVKSDIKKKLDKNQGTANSGKILGVDASGEVAPTDTEVATLVNVPNGIVKGDGSTLSAAVAGTDYMAPVTGGTTGQVLTKTANGQEWQSVSKNNVGLGNVDNVKQYSASNPPPYPVTSVNGKTGAVMVSVPTVPSTTSLIKGDGSGGLVAATRGRDYIASGNIVKQTLVATETTPTENYAINWVYG